MSDLRLSGILTILAKGVTSLSTGSAYRMRPRVAAKLNWNEGSYKASLGLCMSIKSPATISEVSAELVRPDTRAYKPIRAIMADRTTVAPPPIIIEKRMMPTPPHKAPAT